MVVRPYQIEGIARIHSRNTLVRFEPGLGKTGTTAAAIRGLSRVLISAPKSAQAVWYKDLLRFGGFSEIIELEGNQNIRVTRKVLGGKGVVHEEPARPNEPTGVFFTTHECLRSWAGHMNRGPIRIQSSKVKKSDTVLPEDFEAFVIDESHKFGNKDSKKAIGARALTRVSQRTVLLTGTPDWGGTHRLWFQFVLLLGPGFMKYYDFLVRYCGAIETKYGLQPTHATNQEELRVRMDPWVISYRQVDVASFLPKHTRDRVIVPLTPTIVKAVGPKLAAAAKALRSLQERESFCCDSADTSGLSRPTSNSVRFLPGEVIEARLACAHAKVSTVVEYAEELLHVGEHVVLWAWHREVCAAVAQLLKERGRPYYCVTGEMTSQARVDITINSWAAGDPSVLIATIGKLGVGEDRLVRACWQLFLEIDWLPQSLRQAENRLLRLSQTRPVNTRFFQLDVPFERSLMDRVLERAGDTDSLFGGSDSIDIGELFGVEPIVAPADVLQRLNERLS